MSTILAAFAVIAQSASGLLVSPSELAAMLKDPAIVVIAVGNQPGEFEAGHVPGSRFVRYGDIAIDVDGLQSELPPADQLRRVLTAAGITDRSKVIIYGSPIAATRMFFTLDYFGHPYARVLNGGLNAWKANGGSLETGPPIKHGLNTDPSSLTPKVRADRVVSADWIKERLSSPSVRLLDARPDAEFTGDDGGMNGMHVKGHLPDARQLVWNTLLDSSGKFLPDAELRKKYEAIGAAKGTPLVSYCMVGMRASVTYFVARHLGYDARMYDGSIVDWTRRKLPAVVGK
jgi:thiosulfate/3-mercaptopyruvate sulfurtransferase